MATESPFLRDGGHWNLSTSQDARKSSITGTNVPGGPERFHAIRADL